MSKGLEALKETAIQIVEALYGKDEPLRNNKINELLETRQFKCIEKELLWIERLEEILKQYDIFSVYELQDRLERLNDIEKAIKKIFPNNEYTFGLLVNKIRNIELQEETDEVLEIIREKRVDVRYLQECENLKQYNDFVERNWSCRKEAEYHNEILTQQEFDLLKEVL